MKKFLFFSVTMFFLLSLLAVSYAQSVNYEQWKELLHTYVNEEGFVDYDALNNNREHLDQFITEQIQNADVTTMTEAQQKAFWINSYNALTIQLILDHYPPVLNTIRTINWGRPWSKNFTVAGRELSLGGIEHEILRKWDPPDARIHFAINCASIGCPALNREPFYSETLDAQLDKAAEDFINNPDKVRLDREEKVLYHSEIFNWFKEDFVAEAENVLEYIVQFMNDQDRAFIQKNKADIRLKTISYDWGLNEQKD